EGDIVRARDERRDAEGAGQDHVVGRGVAGQGDVGQGRHVGGQFVQADAAVADAGERVVARLVEVDGHLDAGGNGEGGVGQGDAEEAEAAGAAGVGRDAEVAHGQERVGVARGVDEETGVIDAERQVQGDVGADAERAAHLQVAAQDVDVQVGLAV